MAQLPINMNSTKFTLDDTFFEVGKFTYVPDYFIRDYCGMSGIGAKCLRALQYSCFMASKKEIFAPRTQRIFDLGHILEEYIVQMLINSGIEVTDQQKELIGFAGHWKGHIDGIAHNVPESPKTPHLLEIKTHNDKSWQDVRKNGVEKSKPPHYAQMMRYMEADNLKRGLYIAYNKNDSSIYSERIRYDAAYASELVRKEQEILLSEKLFPRIGNGKPGWHECKFCNHKDVCFHKIEVSMNCRTCTNVDMKVDGIWRCSLDDKNLDYEQQKAACKMYEISGLFKS